MACHAIYFLDLKGKVILSRNYRGDLPTNAAQRFISRILEEEEDTVRPIFQDYELSYIYLKHTNLYLMAVTDANANAAMIVLFLQKIIEVFIEYFKELEEESLRDNFVIVYELLDEMMDFGYPQTTEAKILQEYITQESHKLDRQLHEVQVSKGVTGAVTWRPPNLKYRKNEVFLDVIESVNLLVASNGTLLRSEIQGSIKMRVFLTGMPELRLGLNERVQFEAGGTKTEATGKGKAIEMEDVQFHQCVKLSRFEQDKIISFIPPDGEFELMNYRLNTSVKPLIWIEALVENHPGSRVEYLIKAKSQFKPKSTANNVDIFIPVPRDADTPKFKASIGTVSYDPAKNRIIWNIKQFQGGREFLMRAHFGLPSIQDEDQAAKPPISVKFEIPYFTVSGIQVRYLKIIEKSGYQALPWVRYITTSGDYLIRM